MSSIAKTQNEKQEDSRIWESCRSFDRTSMKRLMWTVRWSVFAPSFRWGLMHVQEALEEEVCILAGARYARKAPELARTTACK